MGSAGNAVGHLGTARAGVKLRDRAGKPDKCLPGHATVTANPEDGAMSSEKKVPDEGHGRKARGRARTGADRFGPEDVDGVWRWGAIYPYAMLAQTFVAAALLVAVLVINGTTPADDAALVEAATRLALAIVFVAVYLPATAMLLRWYAERREAQRLLEEARQDVEAILRTHRP